ncbi:MAG TPA: globin family protein [Terriglobia bacterium]|nr:globin family protein [Terriglobia bacterium]
MTTKQKERVQATFAMVAPIADQAADVFYTRLFTLDPKLRPMFKEDLSDQKKKLMQMLAAAVKGLDNLEALVPVVRDLGARHKGYGVEDGHYDTVAEALLWTLERGLGNEFTPETKEAWVAVYTVLASTMKEGARSAMAARM